MKITASSLSAIVVATACMISSISAAPLPQWGGWGMGGWGGYGPYGGMYSPYYYNMMNLYRGYGVGYYNGMGYYGYMSPGLWMWADGSKHDHPEEAAKNTETAPENIAAKK